MKKISHYASLFLLIYLFTGQHIFAQSEQIRLLSYNLMSYTSSSGRDPYFQTILSAISPSPDIVVACEFDDATSGAADHFRTSVLNAIGTYSMGTFVANTGHSDVNAIYYLPSKFTFLSSVLLIPESTGANHPTYKYQLYNNLTGDKLTIYGVHLTSDSGSGESQRSTDATNVRIDSNALPSGSYFIGAGDFNISGGGTETAYTNLTASGSGKFYDPLSISSDWNGANYQYQTYSTDEFRYRYDLILNSSAIVSAGGVTYLGNYTTYGNDGLHHSLVINEDGSTGQPNQVVSQTIADALLDASDHIPIFADYTFAVPSTINPPYQGSIAFTQVGVSDGSNPDEIEFVTLYRMNLTTLRITNNTVDVNGNLGTGGGTYDLGQTNNTNWTDVPAGTHVRLGTTLTNDNNLNDGILAYNGTGSVTLPTFGSSGGNQVIAYTGSSSSPTYIAGLHWGTSGGWANPSYKPGTASDLALGSLNNYYYNGGLTGTLYTDRNNLVTSSNWQGSSTWQPYYSQPTPVELSSFTGNINNGEAELQWRTATEVNNYGFEVQRSNPLLSPLPGAEEMVWVNIGFVAGSGNSNSPKSYSFVDKSMPVGIIYYRLKQEDNDGKFEYSATIVLNNNEPSEASLAQNYPNPFNPVSTIEYTVPTNGFVSLKVYDILGREVTSLVNEKQNAGKHSVSFNGTGLASGIYFYVLTTNNLVLSKKMNLLK